MTPFSPPHPGGSVFSRDFKGSALHSLGAVLARAAERAPASASLTLVRCEIRPDAETAPVALTVTLSGDDLRPRFSADGPDGTLARGEIWFDPPPSPPPLDVAAARRNCPTPMTPPFPSAIVAAWLGDGQSLAGLRLTDGGTASLPPKVLDAMALLAARITTDDQTPRTPIRIGGLSIHRPLSPHLLLHARRGNGNGVVNLVLAQPDGMVCVSVMGYEDTSSAQPAAAQSGAGKEALTWLLSALADELRMDIGEIFPDTPFEELGIDSVLSVQLTRPLERRLGDLSKTLFFEHRPRHSRRPGTRVPRRHAEIRPGPRQRHRGDRLGRALPQGRHPGSVLTQSVRGPRLHRGKSP